MAVHGTFAQIGQTSKNGFDLTEALIPIEEIKFGGPPRDGIPSIDNPKFVGAREATFLKGNDRILGVVINGLAKAYPIGILNYHEIVNDFFEDQPVVVTYCPLCGSGVAFKAMIKERARTFGVSGLLYNSDVLLYDRESNSLFSQLRFEAISGPLKGTRLEVLPTSNTTWSHWKKIHPTTVVLSTETGFSRDYSQTPYKGYDQSEAIYFPVSKKNDDYHPKEYIIGLEVSGKFKAYPFSELSKVQSPLIDYLGKQKIEVHFDAEAQAARITDRDGKELPHVTTFWFAWFTFHPDTEIFRSK